MIFTIDAIELKNADWAVADVHEGIEGGQSYQAVSLNRIDKNTGKVAFEDFDKFAAGYQFQGEPWKNASGKFYIFAPKPKAATGGRPGGAAITKAMETKNENIKEAQERKAESIALAGAMRDATQITLAELKDQPFPTTEDFQERWKFWVKWLLNQHNQPFL